MAALDRPGAGPAPGAFQRGGAAQGSAGGLGAPRTPGCRPAARRTAKEVTYPDTRTSVEQRAKHAPNPLRLEAPVTCAGEWGGAGAGEVPVPTSCAAPVAASAQVWGSRESRLLLRQVSVKLSQRARAGRTLTPASPPQPTPRASRPALPSPASGAPVPRPPDPDPPPAWFPRG